VDAGDGGLGDERVAGPSGLHLGGGELVLGGVPGFCLEPAIAAEHPLEVDEGVDEGALGRGGGPVLGGELRFEGLELDWLRFALESPYTAMTLAREQAAAAGTDREVTETAGKINHKIADSCRRSRYRSL
jgi:hypothetical protein